MSRQQYQYDGTKKSRPSFAALRAQKANQAEEAALAWKHRHDQRPIEGIAGGGVPRSARTGSAASARSSGRSNGIRQASPREPTLPVPRSRSSSVAAKKTPTSTGDKVSLTGSPAPRQGTSPNPRQSNIPGPPNVGKGQALPPASRPTERKPRLSVQVDDASHAETAIKVDTSRSHAAPTAVASSYNELVSPKVAEFRELRRRLEQQNMKTTPKNSTARARSSVTCPSGCGLQQFTTPDAEHYCDSCGQESILTGADT
jgi:hypothetical protein